MPPAFLDVDQLLDEVVTLPSLPDTVVQLNQMLNDPDCSMAEVARTISMDPSIALKTLRLVNSAYYGLGQEVKTVDHAVVMLGVKVIKNLVLTASVFDTFQGSIGRFLEHCISTGVAMKVLAAHGPLKRELGSPDEAFVFGLLHDIGKVIIRQFMPEESERIAQLIQEKRISWYHAELEVIGVDHATIGARLAQKWKLNKGIVAAIAFHHDMQSCPADYARLAGTLAVADHFVSCAGYPSYDNPILSLQDEAWAASGLERTSLPTYTASFCAALTEVQELLAMAG